MSIVKLPIRIDPLLAPYQQYLRLDRLVAHECYKANSDVYCHGKTVDEVKQNLTVGFQTVVQWFQQNCLTINIKKTHSMFLGRKKRRSEIEHLCIEHDGRTLRNEQTARYLGVFLDDKLC